MQAFHLDRKRQSQTKLVHTQSTAFYIQTSQTQKLHTSTKQLTSHLFSFTNLVDNTNQTYVLSTQQYSLCHQGENE